MLLGILTTLFIRFNHIHILGVGCNLGFVSGAYSFFNISFGLVPIQEHSFFLLYIFEMQHRLNDETCVGREKMLHPSMLWVKFVSSRQERCSRQASFIIDATMFRNAKTRLCFFITWLRKLSVSACKHTET